MIRASGEPERHGHRDPAAAAGRAAAAAGALAGAAGAGGAGRRAADALGAGEPDRQCLEVHRPRGRRRESRSAARASAASTSCATTAAASTWPMPTACSAPSSGCMAPTSSPARASGWRRWRARSRARAARVWAQSAPGAGRDLLLHAAAGLSGSERGGRVAAPRGRGSGVRSGAGRGRPAARHGRRTPARRRRPARPSRKRASDAHQERAVERGCT